MRKCKKCGADLTEEAKFCGGCGNPCDQPTINKDKTDYMNSTVGNFDIMIKRYAEYSMVVYLILNVASLLLTYRWIINYFPFIGVSGLSGMGFVGFLYMLFIIGLSYLSDKVYDIGKEKCDTEFWLFHIKSGRRAKVAKVTKIISKVLGIVLSLAVIGKAIEIYEIYGFSWMLVLSIIPYLNAMMLAEFLSIFSKACIIEIGEQN